MFVYTIRSQQIRAGNPPEQYAAIVYRASAGPTPYNVALENWKTGRYHLVTIHPTLLSAMERFDSLIAQPPKDTEYETC